MNSDELKALLRQAAKAEGSLERFAERHNLSAGYLRNFLCGLAKPGPAIALALGLKKVVSFEPIGCPVLAQPEGKK